MVRSRKRRINDIPYGSSEVVGGVANEPVEVDGQLNEDGNGVIVELLGRTFGTPITRHWDTPLTRTWIPSCTSFFSGAKTCAWCGKVHIQPHRNALKSKTPFMGIIPYSVTNHFYLDLCMGIRNRSHWYVCKGCLVVCHYDTLSRTRVNMSSEYISDLLNCPIQELSLLSILDIGCSLRVEYNGFYNGCMCLDSLINGPIFTWDAIHDMTYY
jgi:hypothetical protein